MTRISWGGTIGGVVLVLLGLAFSVFELVSAWAGDVLSKAIIEYASPEFMRWFRMLGILIAVRGIYLIVTSFFVPSTLIGRMLAVGGQMLSAMAIPLLVWLREHLDLLPVASVHNGQVVVGPPQGDLANVLRWCLHGVMALIILGIATSLIRLFRDSQLSIGSTPSG